MLEHEVNRWPDPKTKEIMRRLDSTIAGSRRTTEERIDEQKTEAREEKEG